MHLPIDRAPTTTLRSDALDGLLDAHATLQARVHALEADLARVTEQRDGFRRTLSFVRSQLLTSSGMTCLWCAGTWLEDWPSSERHHNGCVVPVIEAALAAAADPAGDTREGE